MRLNGVTYKDVNNSNNNKEFMYRDTRVYV
jgi:hypothetical protein